MAWNVTLNHRELNGQPEDIMLPHHISSDHLRATWQTACLTLSPLWHKKLQWWKKTSFHSSWDRIRNNTLSFPGCWWKAVVSPHCSMITWSWRWFASFFQFTTGSTAQWTKSGTPMLWPRLSQALPALGFWAKKKKKSPCQEAMIWMSGNDMNDMKEQTANAVLSTMS